LPRRYVPFAPQTLTMNQPDIDKDRELIYAYNYPLIVKKAIQELQGLAGLMIFDGTVSDEEIIFLGDWLKKNKHLLTTFPLSDLDQLFANVVATGEITDEARKKLFVFLDAIASGVKGNSVVDAIFAKKPTVKFNDRLFLFTGDMEFGSRDKAESAVIERGGEISKSCTIKTDYLVVGNLGSEAYKYSRFGTKIEKALQLQREKKSNIQIIRERYFVQSVLTTPPAKPKPKKSKKVNSFKGDFVEMTISLDNHNKYVCGSCNTPLDDPTEDCPSCGSFLPISTK
jgi:hypothetical protein